MDLITIHTCDNSFEAHNLKNRLEAENIQAFIFDENLISLQPLYSQAIGGIKLKVDIQDVPSAEAILHAIDTDQYQIDREWSTLMCPNCGCNQINHNIKDFNNLPSIIALLFSFLFLVCPIYWRNRSQCEDCGHIFSKS